MPNETIDDAVALDFMALALLTILLRHRDGWEITLAEIGKKYGYGRDAMANAIGLLQVARYVVKIRMMSTAGTQWSTEVYVFDTPATDEEITSLVANAARLPEVRRASVIEPTPAAIEHAQKRYKKLAPKQGRTAPTMPVPRLSENPHSGATCGNDASSQVNPECGFPRQSGDPAVNKKTVGKKTNEKTEAPPGRSPVDGVAFQAEVVRAAGDEGGSAASSKTKPAPSKSRKPRHTHDELTIVDQVLAYLPPQIPAREVRVPAVADAILAAMREGGRSVEEMGGRINARWADHGFADKAAVGPLEKPIGVVIALVRPLRRGDRYACADIRCEDGRNLDTDEPCRLCEVRAADWKAAQQRKRAAAGGKRDRRDSAPAMPSQRAAETPARPLMEDCSGPYCTRSIPAGKGMLCGDCLDQQEAEAAVIALAAEWEADQDRADEQAALTDEQAAEFAREVAEREALELAEAEQRAAAEEEKRRKAAEEDARLRAEFARQNPHLAAFSSQGPAPF
ncbi:hypothetical protein [Streptomyces cinereoruber]|uniref:hypothetical protein n=1 Tax=Streptomyces cinereoruber TaxID=67260 RepID=UPI003639D15E